MKLCILGASGGVGRQLATQALARGHTVTAVVRAGSKVDLPPSVPVLRGDLSSVDFLRTAIRGHDAVASGLGLRLPGLAPWAKAEDPAFLRTSTTALLQAMAAEGVTRVTAVSSCGVGDSAPVMPGFFKLFVSMTALKTAYVALDEMEGMYRDAAARAGVDVCVVRPTGLSDGPATGNVVLVNKLAGQAQISRADVAGFMLDGLAQPRFAHAFPVITTTGAA